MAGQIMNATAVTKSEVELPSLKCNRRGFAKHSATMTRHPMFMIASDRNNSWRIPWIDDLDSAALKIADVSRRQSGGS